MRLTPTRRVSEGGADADRGESSEGRRLTPAQRVSEGGADADRGDSSEGSDTDTIREFLTSCRPAPLPHREQPLRDLLDDSLVQPTSFLAHRPDSCWCDSSAFGTIALADAWGWCDADPFGSIAFAGLRPSLAGASGPPSLTRRVRVMRPTFGSIATVGLRPSIADASGWCDAPNLRINRDRRPQALPRLRVGLVVT
jgi:hypothetical protein